MSSKSLYTITLKGVSQVMLQENIYTGLLFFIAIFYVNQIASLYMLLATFLATYFAFEISLDENSLNSGIYGFNAALVGVAVELFFGVSFFSITLLIFGSVLTVLIQEYFRKNSFSLFTLPFILVVWLFLWLFSSFVTLENSLNTDENLELFSMVFKGFSEVFFQVLHLLTSIVLLPQKNRLRNQIIYFLFQDFLKSFYILKRLKTKTYKIQVSFCSCYFAPCSLAALSIYSAALASSPRNL